MKKKLFRVLLVLSLCTALAIPVFAGPAEEPPVPEESKTLAAEESPGLEEIHEHEEEAASRIAEAAGAEEAESLLDDMEGSANEDEKAKFFIVSSELDLSNNGATSLKGTHEHHMVYDDLLSSGYEKNTLQHRTWERHSTYCIMAGCPSTGTVTDYGEWESHSWSKGGLESCQSVDGSTHKATYNYSCKCGATKTESETESHSLSKYDFGSNYHKGKLHYVEWIWRCSDCGYTVRRWESQSCPGNDNGEGCIFGINKIDPPVEVQDVAGPEEAPANEMWAREAEEGIETDIYQQLLMIMNDPNFGTDENYSYVLGDAIGSAANLESIQHSHIWAYSEDDFCGYLYERIDDSQHNVYKKYNVHCIGCGEKTVQASLDGAENHSWRKGSFVGYQKSSTVAHKAVYNYSCKCGATKTDGELESHSMKGVGYTGNNYHQGTKHYAEYESRCSQCGYTKTQYESYSCPGPTGGGCIMPDTPINRIDPPVEVQDVAGPEEAA